MFEMSQSAPWIRLIISMLVGFGVTATAYPIFIPFLHKIKFGQTVREEGPESHKAKTGTPTMGGIIFILVSLIVTFVVDIAYVGNYEMLLVAMVFVGFGLIGFVDDFLIVVKKVNEGLSAKAKLLCQIILTVIFYALFLQFTDTTIWIPIVNTQIDVGHIGYFLFVLLMFVAESNATNLTDGLDGLLAGCTCIVIIPFFLIAWMSGVYGLALLLGTVEACMLGYLLFNKKPAKIFMGDTGSLAIGGLLAASSMILKVELLLVIAGGIFVIEVISVVLQVVSFKTRGKRIFKMAPIHHHFELSGWSETKVVHVFWGISAVLSALAFFLWYIA